MRDKDDAWQCIRFALLLFATSLVIGGAIHFVKELLR